MSILVTGAAGFIGCNNVLELNRRGYKDVIAVDNLTKSEKFLNLAKVARSATNLSSSNCVPARKRIT